MSNKIVRQILHWTGGGGRASDVDKKHYHRLVEFDGEVVLGNEAIEDNVVTSDDDYARHTLRLNSGSIGIALCGMRDAQESPFDAGPSPINEAQFDAACRLIADLCLEYGIPVTAETVLTHAEVEPTLGVKQRGKWDIIRLPWRPDIIGAIPVGNYMRAKVAAFIGQQEPGAGRPILRFGDRGSAVRELQMDLAALRYQVGKSDGVFGALTRAAVLALQADVGLITDGVVGKQTWAAIGRTEPRVEREVTVDDLRERGSRTIQSADTAEVGLVGTGLLTTANFARDIFEEWQGLLPTITATVRENWPALLGLAAIVLVWYAVRSMKAARIRDARSGAHIGR